jgi:hypothetical protein
MPPGLLDGQTLYAVCKRDTRDGLLLCCFQDCTSSFKENRKMKEHLINVHHAPMHLALHNSDIPPDSPVSTRSPSPGPLPSTRQGSELATITAATSPEPPHASPPGLEVQDLPRARSSKGKEREEPVQEDPPSPASSLFSSPSFILESNALNGFAFPSPAAAFVDNDDARPPSPSPSPLRLRSGRRVSQATDAAEEADPTEAVDADIVEGQLIDESPSSSSGSQPDDDDDDDPTPQMLTSLGLFIIPVDDETSVLACIGCKKGLKPSNALMHVTSAPHKLKISKPRRAEVKAWITDNSHALADNTHDLPDPLPQDEAPVKGLKVFNGLACSIGNCRYCCLSKKSFATHWSSKHRTNALRSADGRRDAHVQRHFRSHPRYFAVEPALAGADPKGPLYQYIKQFNKRLARETSDSRAAAEPISPTEVPPLLQETQWHSHLSRFTRSKKKLNALLSLTRLPTGKKAQQDPLGDTLRQTIILYMRNIHKKARDSDLDVRALLIEC